MKRLRCLTLLCTQRKVNRICGGVAGACHRLLFTRKHVRLVPTQRYPAETGCPSLYIMHAHRG